MHTCMHLCIRVCILKINIYICIYLDNIVCTYTHYMHASTFTMYTHIYVYIIHILLGNTFRWPSNLAPEGGHSCF